MAKSPSEGFADTLRALGRGDLRARLLAGGRELRLTKSEVAALESAMGQGPWEVTSVHGEPAAAIAFDRDGVPFLTLNIGPDDLVWPAGSTLGFVLRDQKPLLDWLARRRVDTTALTAPEADRASRKARWAAREAARGRAASRAEAASLRQQLSPSAWERLLEEVRRDGTEEDVARVTAARAGEGPHVPAGAELVAVADHRALRSLHNDDTHACALDGGSLRWFGPGAPENASIPVIRVTAIAVHRGHVLARGNGITRVDVRTKHIESAKEPGLLRRFWRSPGKAEAAFHEEAARLCLRHLGQAPPRWAGQAWILAEPSPNDFAAHDAFGHLGVPEPAALALPHLWVYRPGDAALHGLPRQRGAQAVEVPLAGPAVALAAGERVVHALVRVERGCQWLAIGPDGGQETRGTLALAPAAVRAIRDFGTDLLVHAGDLLGDFLLRWPRAREPGSRTPPAE